MILILINLNIRRYQLLQTCSLHVEYNFFCLCRQQLLGELLAPKLKKTDETRPAHSNHPAQKTHPSTLPHTNSPTPFHPSSPTHDEGLIQLVQHGYVADYSCSCINNQGNEVPEQQLGSVGSTVNNCDGSKDCTCSTNTAPCSYSNKLNNYSTTRSYIYQLYTAVTTLGETAAGICILAIRKVFAYTSGRFTVRNVSMHLFCHLVIYLGVDKNKHMQLNG